MRRQRPDDRPSYVYQPTPRDDGYQLKRQRPNSKLPPGRSWPICFMDNGVDTTAATETPILIFLSGLFCT